MTLPASALRFSFLFLFLLCRGVGGARLFLPQPHAHFLGGLFVSPFSFFFVLSNSSEPRRAQRRSVNVIRGRSAARSKGR